MGEIRDDFGVISIESRRESFYIHASYGWEPKQCQARDVGLGRFCREGHGPVMKIVGHLMDVTLAEYAGEEELCEVRLNPTLVVIPCDDVGREDDQQESDHPLGRLWTENPHPEFDLGDLDDLIAALVDYRESM